MKTRRYPRQFSLVGQWFPGFLLLPVLMEWKTVRWPIVGIATMKVKFIIVWYQAGSIPRNRENWVIAKIRYFSSSETGFEMVHSLLCFHILLLEILDLVCAFSFYHLFASSVEFTRQQVLLGCVVTFFNLSNRFVFYNVHVVKTEHFFLLTGLSMFLALFLYVKFLHC